MKILLASQSPRRRSLLRQAGLEFEVVEAMVDEVTCIDKNLPYSELAVINAQRKALKALSERNKEKNKKELPNHNKPDEIIIGADTIVILNEEVLGKPKDKQDAIKMLTRLSGKEHQVITGVAVAVKNKILTDFAVTTVGIRPLSLSEIEKYVETGEPMDKAGSYGIQEKGILFVEYINGCYTNVVGLPLVTLFRLLNEAGVANVSG